MLNNKQVFSILFWLYASERKAAWEEVKFCDEEMSSYIEFKNQLFSKTTIKVTGRLFLKSGYFSSPLRDT